MTCCLRTWKQTFSNIKSFKDVPMKTGWISIQFSIVFFVPSLSKRFFNDPWIHFSDFLRKLLFPIETETPLNKKPRLFALLLVRLCFCLFVLLSVCLFVLLFVSVLYIYSFVWFVCLSVCLLFLSECLSNCPYLCSSVSSSAFSAIIFAIHCFFGANMIHKHQDLVTDQK